MGVGGAALHLLNSAIARRVVFPSGSSIPCIRFVLTHHGNAFDLFPQQSPATSDAPRKSFSLLLQRRIGFRRDCDILTSVAILSARLFALKRGISQ